MLTFYESIFFETIDNALVSNSELGLASSPGLSSAVTGSADMVMKYSFSMIVLAFCLLMPAAPCAVAQTAEQNTYLRHLREGADLLKQGDHRRAWHSFDEALRYYDGDPAAYVGIGIAAFHLREDTAAERALRQALERDPRQKRAYEVLGDLAYRRDDLAAAAENWGKALAIEPADQGLKARLERVQREHRTEKDFNKDATGRFSAKYEGREKIEAGRIVLRTLEDAYGDIGRQLSFYPDREIAVILYSDQQFQEVTDAPGWSGGIYDGKIRIPIGGIERETPGLRAVLYHEYTHALVRAITPRTPVWLNEGLAQYFEGREVGSRQKEVLRRLLQGGHLPPLASLEGSFLGYGGSQAGYAYLISLSAVTYMVDRYGMHRVRMVLDALAAGEDSARALGTGLMASAEEFERAWCRSLE